jgi:alpha-beta hydrolase superfamily lysophospholipase
MNHIEGKFKGYNNLALYHQCWLPSNEPKTVLLLVHGLHEHSGRYMNLVNHFVAKGYAVYGFDQRGHGKSQGLRGYVEQFSYFINDLNTFLSIVRSEHQDAKIFIVGHSIGGTIATAYAVYHQAQFDGLILSGATLKAGTSISRGLIIIARLLSLLLPKMGLYVIDASAISRDKAIVDAYVDDPLVYRGKIRARLGTELIKVMQILPRQMPKISLPILIMHGTADRLSDPNGSQMLYDGVSSRDKTLKLYDGFYHEIFNEPGHEQVFVDMEAWLAARI